MKKHYLLLTILTACFTYTATAQDWQWIKAGGSSSSSLSATTPEGTLDIGTDAQRNVYILSRLADGNSTTIEGNPIPYYGDYVGNADHIISKYSCDGTYQWSRVIGGGGTENIDALAVDPSGNVYVAGNFGGCNGSTGYPNQVHDVVLNNEPGNCTLLFIAKFDTNGNTVWVKEPQAPTTGSSAGADTRSFNFVLTDTGEIHWLLFLPPGSYADGAFINTQPGSNFFIFKYDLQGNFIEAVPLTIAVNDNGYKTNLKMYRNPYSGNYVLSSTKSTDPATISFDNGTPLTSGALIAGFDTTGQFLWVRENTWQQQGTIFFHGIDFDVNNDMYIGFKMVGYNMDNFLGVSTSDSGILGFVLKANSDASSVYWSTHHDRTPSNLGDLILYNGDLYTTFWATDLLTWGNVSDQITSSVADNPNVVLAKLDATTGNCLMVDHINGTPGNYDNGWALEIDTAGDLLVGGYIGYDMYDANGGATYSNGGYSDYFIAKYAMQACQPLKTTTVIDAGIEVYPNPAQDALHITTQEALTYSITTLEGKQLATGTITTTNPTIAVAHYPTGIYLVTFTKPNGATHTTKLVKE
ncbi:T9SS type A sorting domain-containing protein [Neptunitalea lumnitzerae]|uniref:Secretion system C-terminal sorting domain-containing protein n=1 Tax=Neptunitalea lumnitzerae TaxID=2965509 RepID=A0ABQ5MLY3_9FLAO|nr:T9SS type A sorting domain-containing protein [Neptunitalea sp. Y10]GLB50401.1 hypothetical protein Y10_27690 [Neptunitalea sp. Y10]